MSLRQLQALLGPPRRRGTIAAVDGLGFRVTIGRTQLRVTRAFGDATAYGVGDVVLFDGNTLRGRVVDDGEVYHL